MHDLQVFTAIVRPTRTMTLAEAEKEFADKPTEDAILFYGADKAAVEAFAKVAPRVGFGSAFALFGVPSKSITDLDDAEKIARANHFAAWFRGTEMPGFPADARTWVKHIYDGNTYGTHWPILKAAVKRTEGAVLELGAGASSTGGLHDMCGKQGRLVVTVDSAEEWVAKFKGLASDKHVFECIPDPAETKWLNEKWDVVFVDHAPGETRMRAIERARDKAEFIVVHDSDDLGYGIEKILSTFKYRKDFRRQRPWTTVVSMTKEVW